MGSDVRDRLNGLSPMARVANESFAGMHLPSLHPEETWFDRCDFSETDLRLASFDRCFFRFCSFVRADLVGASIRDARFAGCDFTDADLTNCDLTGSTFGFVNTGTPDGLTVMTGAILEGAILKAVVTERVVGWHQA
jgi:uncharacterized protein YjbI with pentapeptide repeats